MWSHYADFHRGFCIGFKDNLDMPVNSIKEVIYSATIDRSSLLKLLLEGGTEERFLEEHERVGILTKFHDWKYEQEWRIIGVKGIVTYGDSCTSEIIFGLKMPQDNRDRIISALKDKKINYFEVVKSKRDLAVDIVPLSQ